MTEVMMDSDLLIELLQRKLIFFVDFGNEDFLSGTATCVMKTTGRMPDDIVALSRAKIVAAKKLDQSSTNPA